MEYTFAQYRESADAVKEKIGDFQPEVALILGSGLGYLGDEVENAVAVDYKDIPHFKASTAPGHKGRLVLGTLKGKRVAVMQGRMHHSEGYDYKDVSYGVRVMRLGENDKVMVLARTDHDDEAQTETVEAEEGDEPTAEQLAAMEAADEAAAAEAPEAENNEE